MTVRTNLRLGLITILLVCLCSGLAPMIPQTPAGLPADDSYTRSIDKWRAERLEEINGEDGWTTLVGLFWLKEGKNRFGSHPSNDIVLPAGTAPKFAGLFRLDKETVTLEAGPDAGVTRDGESRKLAGTRVGWQW